MWNSPCILIQNLADSFEEIKCFDRINLAFETKTKHGFQSFLLSLAMKILNYNATVFVSSDREYSSCDALWICILDNILDILDISISTIIRSLLIFIFFFGVGVERGRVICEAFLFFRGFLYFQTEKQLCVKP